MALACQADRRSTEYTALAAYTPAAKIEAGGIDALVQLTIDEANQGYTNSGQNDYYPSYATAITPAGDIRFCRSDSVGGKLLIYCYDKAGVAQPTQFGFTTFKP
jgi:hypothetical protein